MNKVIDYGTKFKFEWAEGKRSITDKYVGKELCLQEFIYLITKRHHEIASENIAEGFYGCYDKHKCWVKYDNKSDWEILDRLDLGNDEDFAWIRKMITEHFSKEFNFYWGDAVREGKEMWKLHQLEMDSLSDIEKNWVRFEKVRQSGEYNMITEFSKAMYKANLTRDEYLYIVENYDKIKDSLVEKYGEEKLNQIGKEL